MDFTTVVLQPQKFWPLQDFGRVLSTVLISEDIHQAQEKFNRLEDEAVPTVTRACWVSGI